MNKKQLTYPYIVWLIGFTIIPILIIFYYAFTSNEFNFTLDNILNIPLKPIILAIVLSLISTIICLILSYPLCLILSRFKLKNNNFIIFLFVLPMWMNFLLRTLAWQTILEKNGVINHILKLIGLNPIKIINTPTAIIIGMVYNFLPFMILPIYNSLIKIDDDVINASMDLGATKTQTFFKIILPLTKPGILSAVTMVFVPSLTTFAISDILGGSKIYLIGNVIEQEFKQGDNWHVGSGLSFILMIFVLISMAFMKRYDVDYTNRGDKNA